MRSSSKRKVKSRATPSPGGSWRTPACGALLALAVIVVYFRVIGFDFIWFDDPGYILQNPYVRQGLSWSGIAWAFGETQVANWHPLTIVSYLVDAQLWGLNAGAFHATNLAFHTLNTLVLLLLLRRLTGDLAPSAFVAALFGLHPLHVESVAWISERKDVLSAFFMLLTIWAYAAWVADRKWWRYVLMVLLYALGLMSKPMLVTLPFALLLLDYWPLRRLDPPAPRRSQSRVASDPRLDSSAVRQLLGEKIPLFVMSAVTCVVTVVAQRGEGAMAAHERLSHIERVANASTSYFRYLGQMIWPQNLAVLYPLPPQINLVAGAGAAVALIVISLLVLVMARRLPHLFTGWFWYVGTLVPVIGIVQVGGQSHADRYTYIPLIGIYLVIAFSAARLVGSSRRAQRTVTVCAIVIVAALATRTWFQVGYWRDTETLFHRTLSIAPDNPLIHYNLAGLLAENARYADAIEHYRHALRLQPGRFTTWYNLALVLAGVGEHEEAAELAYHAVRLGPDFPDTHNARAIVAFIRQDFEQARQSAARALELDPDHAAAHIVLGRVLLDDNELDRAAEHFAAATHSHRDAADAYTQLAIVRAKRGRLDEAADLLREALRHQPGNVLAHETLAAILIAQGKHREAETHIVTAFRTSGDPGTHLRIGFMRLQQNRPSEAAEAFAKAARLDPHDLDSRYHLAMVLMRHDRLDDAAVVLNQAVAIAPEDPEIRFQLGLNAHRRGKLAEAIDHYRVSLRQSPYSPARNNLAWILATAPQDQLRDGHEAVRLIEELHRHADPRAETLNTLAAAYAETGRFDDAIATVLAALRAARQAQQQHIIRDLEMCLEFYRRNEPYRDHPTENTDAAGFPR